MKNVIVRTLGMLLLFLVPGVALAQTPDQISVGVRGQDGVAKTAQLCGGIPDQIPLGGILDFAGFIQNTGQIPLNNVVLELNTDLLQQSNHTTDKGQWTVQQPQQGRLEAGTLNPGNPPPNGEQVNFGFRLTAVAPGQAITVFTIFFDGGPPAGQVEECPTFIEDRPPHVEHDEYGHTTALVQLVGGPIGNRPRPFILWGPAAADVFFEGPNEGDADDNNNNGLDEVDTELVELNLTDGNITLTLNPNQASLGQIEELVNNTPGLLDLNPFAPGEADSFFDVFFQIDVGGGVLVHNQQPLRIEARINHKPPFDRYIHIIPPGGAIELLDQNNNRTGIFIVRAEHYTGFVEIDWLEQTTALVQLVGGPLGPVPQEFILRGSAHVNAFFEGPEEGQADDDDDNNRDEIDTELVEIDLTDGNVTLRLNPNQASTGQIEELENNHPGWLDLDPFHDGDADSFFDVFFEIDVGGGLVLHNQEALRIQTVIRKKPPFERYVHLIPANPIELFDANNNPTGIFIIRAEHDTRFVEWDVYEQTTALVQLVGGPLGNQPRAFILRGPAEVHVIFDGEEGEADDGDNNGLDEVETHLGLIDLTDGNITLSLNPNQVSLGQIEELVNNTPGLLDLDPFAPGDADSFFDVFFQIDVGGGLIVHNEVALRIQATIREKPPFDRYIHIIPPGGPIELVDENGRPTGVFIIQAEHDTRFVEWDVYEQTSALVQLVGGPFGNVPQAFILNGPAEAHVFFEGREGEANDDDGNGRDEVETELGSINLTDGNITLSLNPNQVSLGQIEELVNNTPGLLDLDPFAPGDADSFFDVFFQIDVGGGLVVHNEEGLRIQSIIREKPPFDRYIHIIPPGGAIELFDQNGNPTGIFIVRAEHRTGIVEVDALEHTTALVQLVGGPFGNTPQAFTLWGPAEVHVFFEGPAEGVARDDDGNGRDEVDTELVQMQLTNGNITMTTNPNQLSLGQIEELVNNTPGLLDLDPFAPGDADSFFDVFFQVDVGGGLVLHNGEPLRIESTIRDKPPFERYIHLIPPNGPIELLDENGRPTGIFIVKAEHNTGFIEWDHFDETSAFLILEGGPFPGPTPFILRGPTDVHVFFEGREGEAFDDDDNGRDEVKTELGLMNLTDRSGVVRLSLNPTRPSLGEIEEHNNNTPGVLDLPPFTERGTADNFFDVFFQVEVGGQVLFNAVPFRIQSKIRKKPPHDRHVHIVPPTGRIELVDANGEPTGIVIGRGIHHTGRLKVERARQQSRTDIELVKPDGGREVVPLQGPSTVLVYYGENDGRGSDDNGNGLDEVQTEIVSLSLTGTSSLGPVELRINHNRESLGEIEERNNNTPGTLDLPPFSQGGQADSFFDVFFEVSIGSGKDVQVLHNDQPMKIEAVLAAEPDSEAVYVNTETVPLLDENGDESGFGLGQTNHRPLPTSIEVVQVDAEIPSEYELGANYPNPFNAETVIPFGVPQPERVRIEVYNLLGRRVATLLDEVVAAGRHRVTWRVETLPTGVYLVRMTAGSVVVTQRATLVK